MVVIIILYLISIIISNILHDMLKIGSLIYPYIDWKGLFFIYTPFINIIFIICAYQKLSEQNKK